MRLAATCICLSILVILHACRGESPTPVAAAEPSLAALLGANANDGFATATTPRDFEFPRDHGPHKAFRNEWWYVTGNLDGENGRRFGYELTLFRFALAPGAPSAESDWFTNQVYIGHFAISNIEDDEFVFHERVSRGATGLAGSQSQAPRVWLYDWNLRYRPDTGRTGSWQLHAQTDDALLDLSLDPTKPVVLQGVAGLSQKSADAANASYYYSMPRLKTAGTLRLGDEEFSVQGLSWLDREWSSSALSARQAGWDWFAVQLDDGTDLMFYQLRQTDGSIDEFSAGSLIKADGSVVPLTTDDVEIDVLDYWDSPLGGTYPHGWHIRVAKELLDLRVEPAMAAQELATFVRYWEGAVDVFGTRGANRITGRGYVELTGYATAGAVE
ncbi:MAG: carotenoid 1,2-hydratase [Woeseia sp.]|nr:carotenoid 1,2-hydratase [Woeseia sp.]MBT8096800.1 carotenoid 1,2-hydratase [Woeseia sp.]NNE60400.1 carotenoid 1,2-hydratase [Woeseia sp.]NNL53795.1 carotenoid 1,2-hydratase [Woeseia sp.]